MSTFGWLRWSIPHLVGPPGSSGSFSYSPPSCSNTNGMKSRNRWFIEILRRYRPGRFRVVFFLEIAFRLLNDVARALVSPIVKDLPGHEKDYQRGNRIFGVGRDRREGTDGSDRQRIKVIDRPTPFKEHYSDAEH